MAFEIYLYRFSKRSNSDLQPTVNNVLSQDRTLISNCRLKASTSIIQPTIIIDWQFDFAPNFNYMYIPKFSRYYHISNITYVPPVWHIAATVDVLASYRTEISNTYQYVDRCSNNTGYDTKILDSIYPTITPGYSRAVSNLTSLVNNLSGGSFILGTICSQSRTTGAIQYYLCTPSDLSNLLNFMLGGSSWTNVTDVSNDLLKTMFNPFEYIASCMWFPIDPSDITFTTSATIRFGWWDSGVTAKALSSSPTLTKTGSITIPRHPDIAQTGINLEYLMLEPYSRYTLFANAFGEIPIDTTLIYDKTTLYLTIDIDMITGQGKLYISTTSGRNYAFKVVRAQIAADIQLAQISRDILNTAGTALNAVGNITHTATNALTDTIKEGLSGDFLGAGLSALSGVVDTAIAVGTGIISTVQAQLPQLETSGSTGSTLEWSYTPFLLLQYLHIPEIDLANKGQPACKNLLIGDIPGFIQVSTPRIEFGNALQLERMLISQHMRAGFFHEVQT